VHLLRWQGSNPSLDEPGQIRNESEVLPSWEEKKSGRRAAREEVHRRYLGGGDGGAVGPSWNTERDAADKLERGGGVDTLQKKKVNERNCTDEKKSIWPLLLL